MPTVTNYATLTQAILDYAHRPALSAYTDYFIQSAQEEINNDIFAQNFGNGIRLMEATYPATPIDANGNCPVPVDWLTPKDFTVADGTGNVFDLEFKDPQWIYQTYPDRVAAGVPSFIARDVLGSSTFPAVADFLTFTATSNQTVFSLAALSSDAVLFATLDGAMLVPGTDYSIAGSTLTLVSGAIAGQNLYVQGTPVTTSELTFTATSGQTAFSLSGLTNPNVVLATLDGTSLVKGTDYYISGTTLTLYHGATTGQVLYVLGSAGPSADSSSVFIFGPYPDSAYTVGGTYYSQAPLLSGSQATNWMVTSAPSMLFANCMRQAGKFLKDVPMVQGWTQLYQDALAKLIARDTSSRFGESPLVIRSGDIAASGW